MLLAPGLRLERAYRVVLVLSAQSFQLIFHLGDLHSILLIVVEVAKFIRIPLQIVEFPLTKLVELDELVALGANSVVPRDLVYAGILILVIVDAVPPALGFLALEKGCEGASLHVPGNFHSRRLKEGFSVVKVLHQVPVIP